MSLLISQSQKSYNSDWTLKILSLKTLCSYWEWIYLFSLGHDILLLNGACPQQLIVWWSIDDGVIEDWRHDKEFIYPIIVHVSSQYHSIVLSLHRCCTSTASCHSHPHCTIMSSLQRQWCNSENYGPIQIPNILISFFALQSLTVIFTCITHLFMLCVISYIIIIWNLQILYSNS